jgi:hypothetical protein
MTARISLRPGLNRLRTWLRALCGAPRHRQGGVRATRWREPVWLLLAFSLPLLGLPFAGNGGAGHCEFVRALAAPGTVRRLVSAQGAGLPAVYVVVEHWGVFRSPDGGHTWLPANCLPRAALGRVDVSALALSPDDPATLLATIADPSAGWPAVYKTSDGGLTWVARRGLDAPAAEALAIGPRNLVYAARSSRLFRSTDGGDTWLEAGSRPGASRVLAMALDRISGSLYIGTEADGLWLTADQGTSWSVALPGRSVHTIVDAGNGLVYAGASDGLYCSDDRGASWQALSTPGLPGGVSALAVSAGPPDRVFVSINGRPVHLSHDAGESWQAVPGLPPGDSVTALVADPLSPEHLYVGTSKGLWRCRLPPPDDAR